MVNNATAKFCLSISVFVVLSAAILFSPARTVAEDQLPVHLEVTLIGKILSYDQNLKSRADNAGVLRMAILYLPDNPVSERRADDIATSVSTLSQRGLVPDMRVEAFKVPFKNAASLETALTEKSASVVYVCPALEGEIEKIVERTQSRKLLTVGAKESYVVKGISFGVFLERNKPKMVVNLPSSLAEGAKFSSALLRLATVLR